MIKADVGMAAWARVRAVVVGGAVGRDVCGDLGGSPPGGGAPACRLLYAGATPRPSPPRPVDTITRAVAPGQESARHTDCPRRGGHVAAPWAGDSHHPDWSDAARFSRQAEARAAPRAAALGMASHQLDAGQGAPAGVGAAHRRNVSPKR